MSQSVAHEQVVPQAQYTVSQHQNVPYRQATERPQNAILQIEESADRTAPSDLAREFITQFSQKLGGTGGLASLLRNSLSTRLASTSTDAYTLELEVKLLADDFALQIASDFPKKLSERLARTGAYYGTSNMDSESSADEIEEVIEESYSPERAIVPYTTTHCGSAYDYNVELAEDSANTGDNSDDQTTAPWGYYSSRDTAEYRKAMLSDRTTNAAVRRSSPSSGDMAQRSSKSGRTKGHDSSSSRHRTNR